MATKDRWPELLELVADDDGLPCRPCGKWTEQKLWKWNRYLEITTSAMVGNPQWKAGLIYIDLFGGPGVCQIRDTGKRLPGSPLLACRTPKPFDKVLIAELDKALARACETRLQTLSQADYFRVYQGDCNEVVQDMLQEVPDRSLSLAFIDPEGLDVRMSTLRMLAENRRVDFLLLFADAIDLVRNVDMYEQDPESKLHAAFGSESVWRPEWDALQNRSGRNVRALFAKLFEQQIRDELGYAGVRHTIIDGSRGPLYRLIYASKHERGLEFWDKVTKRDISGQHELF